MQNYSWVKRIVIAKSDRFYAQSLQSICQAIFPSAEVSTHRRGGETLDALKVRRADLLMTGMTFSDADGIDLLEEVTRKKLATRTMIVSRRRDEYSLLALRSARFDGYFDTSEEAINEVGVALDCVVSGTGYISPSLRPWLIDRKALGVLEQKLTPAEIHVLCIIGDGSGNAEAAELLCISESTVQTHRRNIMQKLNVSTSARLVREALRLGVVRITDRGTVIRPGFERMLLAWRATKTR